MTTPTGPDCRDGKHRACDALAWDDTRDVLTGCACDCHQTTDRQDGSK